MNIKNNGDARPKTGHNNGSHKSRNTDGKHGGMLACGLPNPGRDGMVVCTLGGVADIGMNWTLYGYDGKYLLVDAGSSFAPREMNDVAAIFPDPRFLESLGDRLVGLVLTHFHEDHVGSIHRIWPKYAKCPIWAPPFASHMLAERFDEINTKSLVKVRTFSPGSAFSIGPFSLFSIPVSHSTPDSVSLVVKTPGGRVLHTGDWKIDPHPGVGDRTNLKVFTKAGDLGVDLLLCDSTNADRERPQSSEASVARALTRVFSEAPGVVIVCSFGSNVGRMGSVATAAKATGRSVALAGRSLVRSGNIARRLGMLNHVPMFVEKPGMLRKLPRNRQVLMCTGTQGESEAALSRISMQTDFRLPEIMPGDIVVHSARAIPGNEEYIDAVFADLKRRGAKIYTADDLFDGDRVHVSGHPVREDLRQLYAAVRPRAAMPVHGTPMHLEAHAELARGCGVTDVSVPVNGGVYRLLDGVVSKLGEIRIPLVAVLGRNETEGMVEWRDGRPVLDGVRLDVSAVLGKIPSRSGGVHYVSSSQSRGDATKHVRTAHVKVEGSQPHHRSAVQRDTVRPVEVVHVHRHSRPADAVRRPAIEVVNVVKKNNPYRMKNAKAYSKHARPAPIPTDGTAIVP
jgi:ribonuclease J